MPSRASPSGPGSPSSKSSYAAAVSGADPIEIRAGFASLLDRIEGNGVRTVIVEDASRFARELMAQELGITLLISRGVRLLTASGDDLTASDDPTRKMMRQIAGAFAEYEKARLVHKLRHARERQRKERGQRHPQDRFRCRHSFPKGRASSRPACSPARRCRRERTPGRPAGSPLIWPRPARRGVAGSGSLAKFTAMRQASTFVNRSVRPRRTGSYGFPCHDGTQASNPRSQAGWHRKAGVPGTRRFDRQARQFEGRLW